MGFGLDFDAAAVGFDDGFALEHADADAAFFGGLKGAEEGAGEEFGGHAAAVVGDGELDGAVVLAGGNFYGAIPYEGKYDAGSLNVLLQEPGNRWSWLPRPQLGLDIKGEIRDIKTIRLAGKQTAFLFAINNDKIIVAVKK